MKRFERTMLISAIYWQPNEQLLTVRTADGANTQVGERLSQNELVEVLGETLAAKIQRPERHAPELSDLVVHALRGDDLGYLKTREDGRMAVVPSWRDAGGNKLPMDSRLVPESGQREVRQAKTGDGRVASQQEVMKAADEAFQRELVRVYGEDNAGDARYKLHHDDEAVQKARVAYWVASDVWREAVREARQIESVLTALEAAGWKRGDGDARASKSFDTVNGRNDALAFVTQGDGIHRTLQFQYISEGRNVAEANGALIPVGATAERASALATVAAAGAEKSIQESYGVRIATMLQAGKQEKSDDDDRPAFRF